MSQAKAEVIPVALGEIKVAAESSVVLVAYGLGSCLALCAYDPVRHIGAMAHVVLPMSTAAVNNAAPAKFADKAVPNLLAELFRMGALRHQLRVKLIGGAQMVKMAGLADHFNIGEKNVDAVMQALAQQGIRPVALDVGGSRGRTVQLQVDTGRVVVRRAGAEEREL